MITPERLRGLMTSCFLATVTLIAIGFGPVLVGLITDYVFGDDNALPLSLLITTLVVAVLGAGAAWKSRRPFHEAMLHS